MGRRTDTLLIAGQIAADQFLQQFIPVNTADLTAGIVMVCNIGRILSQQVTDDLVNSDRAV